MKLIKCIIRPDKVDAVKDALGAINVTGMTVTEVRGHGKQKGHAAIYRGQEYNIHLLPKMQIELVVSDTRVLDSVKAITDAARTGEIGDGRVFVLPVNQSFRIRTGELEEWARSETGKANRDEEASLHLQDRPSRTRPPAVDASSNRTVSVRTDPRGH